MEYNTSLPFAALSVEQAKRLFQDLISHEIPKISLISHPEPFPEFLDIQRAVEYLSSLGIPIPKSAIYKATSNHTLPHRKVGRKLIFSQEDLLIWFNSKIKDFGSSNDSTLLIAKSALKNSDNFNSAFPK